MSIVELAREGKWSTVKKKLKNGLKNTSQEINQLFQLAVVHDKLDIIRIVLNTKDNSLSDLIKYNYLLLAIQSHYNELVELLLNHIPKNLLNTRPPLLHKAIEINNIEAFKMVLKMGGDPNLKDQERRTPLIMAVIHNLPEFVEELLKIPNIRVNVHESNGETALMIAAMYEFDNIMLMLIEAGASINSVNYNDWNMLGYPRAIRDHKFRELLLNSSINVNQLGKYNRNMIITNILNYIGDLGQKKYLFGLTELDIIQYLNDLIPKMDPQILNTLDFWGRSTLWYLVSYGWWDKIRETLEKIPWDIYQKDVENESIYSNVLKEFDPKSVNEFLNMISKSVGCRSTIKYFNLVQKINIIIKPTKNFKPAIWNGTIAWELLLYKYLISKYPTKINNHLPTKLQLTESFTPTYINTLTDPHLYLQQRWGFIWIKNEYDQFPTFYAPKYIRVRDFHKKDLKQFSVFYLFIDWESHGHANSIIVDHVNKKIERFEPHGYKSSHYYEAKGLDTNLKEYFGKVLPGYQFLLTKAIYPRNNIQSYESDLEFEDISYLFKHGFCAAWSIWYIDIILSNWDIIGKFKTRKEFINASLASIHHKFSSAQKYIMGYINKTCVPKKIIELVNSIPEFKKPNFNPEDTLISHSADFFNTKSWKRFLSKLYSVKFNQCI